MTNTKNNPNKELKGENKFIINTTKTIDGEYTVVHNDTLQSFIKIPVVEKEYKAKYVGEFTVRGKEDNWVNAPAMLFWADEPHPEGSNWFIIYFNGEGQPMISDGKSAVEHEWDGILDPETNTVLYSAYRHDYQVFDDLVADGGPEYFRGSLHSGVKIQILDGGNLQIKHLLEKGK